ncbi:hypothetical protein KY495_10270 [Massilia sp. PAMC28688]|uniref:hypothetical protein n=1 Tax=Massilia sp. PAMC28688 TaxID=2861283 RepID=UPI001C630293|nr:hypothetical protein [Massilia sp. PAMC28688]QYF95491.1 hypothetical protein KY495_10270 [Massilia sp. PAMC28688]
MTVTTEDRKQMISRLLTGKPGRQDDAVALSEQVLWLWERIAFHLTPLIGVTGFQTLYARAVHVASPQCPGMTASAPGQAIDTLFRTLKQDLCALDHCGAERCANILLNTFTDLVESMIGEALMEQILRSAWVGQPHGNI